MFFIILACIDSADNAVLMSSFSNYLSDGERRISVEGALQATLQETEKEDLFDLFSRMGSHPNKNVAVETMAHKAVLRAPKHIMTLFFWPHDRCAS